MTPDSGYTPLKEHRYERKFRVEHMRAAAVETVVRHHPAHFREIYSPRWINNIYFDTHGMMHFHDNVVGRSSRRKYRIRWYGDLSGHIARPILEIKIKEGMTGSKRSYTLPPMDLNEGDDLRAIVKSALDQTSLPEDVAEAMKSLTPTLINRYRRTYFLDFSGDFRMTMDTDLGYSGVIDGGMRTRRSREENAVVLELKYEKAKDTEAERITGGLPFRMSKNSKYVNGIGLFRKAID